MTIWIAWTKITIVIRKTYNKDPQNIKDWVRSWDFLEPQRGHCPCVCRDALPESGATPLKACFLGATRWHLIEEIRSTPSLLKCMKWVETIGNKRFLKYQLERGGSSTAPCTAHCNHHEATLKWIGLIFHLTQVNQILFLPFFMPILLSWF